MKRVLIFDDDQDILDVMSFILTEAGWKVKVSDNVMNLTQKINEVTPSVILMDNWIPDIGGIAATKLIKNFFPNDIPVVFITANTNITVLAKEAGADFYLAKPFELSALESIVNKAYLSRKVQQRHDDFKPIGG